MKWGRRKKKIIPFLLVFIMIFTIFTDPVIFGMEIDYRDGENTSAVWETGSHTEEYRRSPASPMAGDIGLHTFKWVSSMGGTSGFVLTGNSLDITPTSNIQHSARLQISLSGVSGGTSYGVGDVEIRIPQSIFFKRDGTIGDTITLPFVEAPTIGGETDFHYYLDEEAGEVVITNYVALAAGFSLECEVSYSFLPSDIADGYVNDEIEARFILKEGNSEYTYDSGEVQEVRVNTSSSLERHTKEFTEKYERWQTSWGTAPADASDYFYVQWYFTTRVRSRCTQPYRIEYTENMGEHGELVGYSSAETGSLTLGAMPAPQRDQPYTSYIDYRYYVVIRYPKSIVEEGKPLIIRNELTAKLIGVDGAEDERSAAAEYEYVEIDFRYQGDLFGVTKAMSVLYGAQIESLPVSMNFLEQGRPATLYYYELEATARALNLINAEGSCNVELIDDLMYLKEEKLMPEDYSIDYFWVGFTEYDYEVTEEGYEDVELTDYSTYNTVEVQYKLSDNGPWKTAGSVERTGKDEYVYNPLVGDPVTYKSSTVWYKYKMEFPESGVCGVRFLNKGNTSYKLVMQAHIFPTIYPTQHVMNLLPPNTGSTLNNRVLLYNIDTLLVTDPNGKLYNAQDEETIIGSEVIKQSVIDHDMEHYGHIVQHDEGPVYLNRQQVSDTIAKTAGNPVVDYEEGFSSVEYMVDMYENVYFHSSVYTSDEIISANIINEQTEGIFYDLLPPGAYVNVDTIDVRTHANGTVTGNRNGVECSFTYEMVENWQGSGQTMLIINTKAPAGYSNYFQTSGSSGPVLQSGFTLYYKLMYPFDSVRDYGTVVLNSVAYRTSNGVLASGKTAAASNLTKKEYFSDLNNDGVDDDGNQDTVYAQNTYTFDVLSALLIGFGKTVKAADSWTFDNIAEVPGLGSYTYRLRYGATNDATTKNLIFYDVLEEFDSGSQQWKGILKEVDTSYAESKGIDVKVYYSVTSGLDPMDITAYKNITDSTVWSLTAPADMADVTAVAVDMSKKTDGTDYILEAGGAMQCLIHMQAPGSYEEYLNPTIYAYNNASYSGTTQSSFGDEDDMYGTCSEVQVYIREPDIEIHKDSDPETGTAAAPALVGKEEDILYHLTIKNRNTSEVMQEVEVTDTIPDGLIIDKGNIAYYFGDLEDEMDLLTNSTRIVLTSNGQKLVFSIDKLSPQEELHLFIPTTVDSGADDDAVFVNTAYITKLHGYEYELESETTYHRIEDEKEGTFILRKADAQDGDKYLEGAEFRLYACEKNHTHVQTVDDTEDGSQGCWDLIDTQISNTSGYFRFENLKSGSYMLVETVAPKGYEIPKGQWLVEFNAADGTAVFTAKPNADSAPAVSAETGEGGTVYYKIRNKKPFALPLAGGRGVQWFILAGVLVMAGAALLWKRQLNRERSAHSLVQNRFRDNNPADS